MDLELTLEEVHNLEEYKEGWRIPTLDEAIVLYKSNLSNPIPGLEEATRPKEEGEPNWIFWTSTQENDVHELFEFQSIGSIGPFRWVGHKKAKARVILIK